MAITTSLAAESAAAALKLMGVHIYGHDTVCEIAAMLPHEMGGLGIRESGEIEPKV
jgi:hypothetical protein